MGHFCQVSKLIAGLSTKKLEIKSWVDAPDPPSELPGSYHPETCAPDAPQVQISRHTSLTPEQGAEKPKRRPCENPQAVTMCKVLG